MPFWFFAILSDKCFSKEKVYCLEKGYKKFCIQTTLCLLIHGLNSSSCRGLWPRLYLPFGQKKAFILFLPILNHFWCSVVTFVTFFLVTLVTLKRIQQKKYPKISKNYERKKSKYYKKSKIIPKKNKKKIKKRPKKKQKKK